MCVCHVRWTWSGLLERHRLYNNLRWPLLQRNWESYSAREIIKYVHGCSLKWEAYNECAKM